MPTNVIPPDILLELLRQGEKPPGTSSLPSVTSAYNSLENTATNVANKTEEAANLINGIGTLKEEEKLQSPYVN